MARVRIEWVRLDALGAGSGATVNQPQILFGAAQVLTVGGSPSTVTAPAIAPVTTGIEGAAFARIAVLSGAINVAWAAGPVAGETTGWRVESRGFALVPVKSGQSVSLVEAADGPSTTASSPIRAVASDRSGSIAAAGAAQDLMAANGDRNGWLIQNQSVANLYVRSKGAASNVAATLDNRSLILPPGGYYEPPKITPHALSIVGGATGQAFFAEEW
jgi:hypothetical protein